MPNNLSKSKSLIKISEAAKLLEVSIDTIRRWDANGTLHSQRPNGKDRFFSIEELEKVKLDQPLTISEVAKRLNLSTTTLRRLDKKGLIKAQRNGNGERLYSRKSLEDYLNSEYSIRHQEIVRGVLEPEEEIKLESPIFKTAPNKTKELVRENQKVLNRSEKHLHHIFINLLETRQYLQGLLTFRKFLVAGGTLLVVTFVLLVALLTIAFLLFPEEMASLLGYTRPISGQLSNSSGQGPAVLGLSYSPKSNQSGSVLGAALKPFSTLSLGLVKQFNLQTYQKIVPKKSIEDVNDIFSVTADGSLEPNYNFTLPDTAFLKIPDQGLIQNLNADYLRGRVPGDSEGNLVVFGSNGSINNLKISRSNLDGSINASLIGPNAINNLDLADDSITSAKIKDGEIKTQDLGDSAVTTTKINNNSVTDEKIKSITSAGKVAGAAVQLSSGGGLTDNSGLSLLTTCSSNQVLAWSGSAWTCATQSGGGSGSSGVTSLNSLTGALTIAGGGINSVSASGSTITITGTEADTLATVTGRGSTTSTTLALNGGITSSSSTPLTLSSTAPIISIGNTGTLSFTDGTNTLMSLADNGTTGILTVTGGLTVSAGPISLPSGSIANAALVNSSITVNVGSGLSGGGAVSLGGAVTLTNTGVTSLTGTSNQVNISASTGAVTLSLPQSIAASSSPSFAALILSNTTNQLILGTTNTITINSNAPSASRVATIPALSADDSFAFLNQTQTLTNKTISGSSNTLTNIPNSALSNSSVTINTTSPMGGGGSLSLGGSLTLTCSTCLTTAGGQIVSITGGNATNGDTFNVTNSASSGTTTANGLVLGLTGTANSTGANTLNALNFSAVSAATNNTFNGLFFPSSSNYNSILNVGGTSIINGSGVVQSAGISGTYSNALTLSSATNNFTVGTLTATGGTINGVTIGGSTPAAGTFTTLTANTNASITGGLNNNSGGITNAGAISGVTSLAASQTITTDTNSEVSITPTANLSATGSINGLTITPTRSGNSGSNTYTINALNLANVAGSCPGGGATCNQVGLNIGTGYTTGVSVASGGLTVTSGGIVNTSGTFSTSGGTISLNASSNNNTNINTGSSAGTVTIGGGSATVALNLGSDTTGDIYYRNSSGNLTRLGVGTSSQVLGGGTTPSWVSIASAQCPTCVVTNPTAAQTITNANSTGFSVAQAATAGSVDIFNVTNNGGGTKYFSVDSSGNVNVLNGANLTQSGAGTFGTGTGAVSLNGDVTIAAGKGLTMTSGGGVFAQTYSSSSDNASAHTLSFTNSSTANTRTVNGQQITPNGTSTSGTNNLNSILFKTPGTPNSNNFYGLDFETGYTDILRYNGSQLISGSGVLQSAGLSGTYSNALTLSNSSNNITVGTLTATGGSINGLTVGQTTAAAGSFTTLTSTQTTTLSSSSGNTAIGNSSGTLQLISSNLNLSTAGVLTLAGGQTQDINSAVSSGAGTALVFQPGTSTGASSNGAAFTIKGGDGSGTTSVNGGTLTLQGGSATGGSGTRNGGDITINNGTGATTNGVINIGTGTGGANSGAKTINIGSTSGDTINIGHSATNAKNINIGDGAVANLITIGSSSAGASSFISGAGLTFTAGANSTWSTTSGNLTVDSAAALNLGTTNATSVSIGRTGVTTTNNGALTSTQTLTASNGLTLTTGALSLTTTSGSISATGFGTTSITSTTATGNINTLADSSLAVAGGSSGNLTNLTFTNTSVNTSGTSTVAGANIAATNNSGITSGATMETYGIKLADIAGTLVSGGTKNNYGVRIGNYGQSGAGTSYGLYIDSQSGSSTNIDLNFAGTSPKIAFGNTGTLAFSDGTNNLATLADNGTTGTYTVGNLTLTNLSTNTGSALCISANVVGTCTAGGGATLQNAYDAGNTITTTTGRNIAFTLASGLGTPTAFTITNNHTSNATDFSLSNNNASGINTNAFLISQDGAGTLTNGLHIARTAGTLTDGILFDGTIGTDITTTAGRALTITPGAGTGNNAGGAITETTGAGAGTGNGGAYSLTGGKGGAAGAATSGTGGTLTLTAGAGGDNSNSSGVAGIGGNVVIDAGGAGTASGGAGAGAGKGSISIGTTNGTSITLGNTSDNTTLTLNGTGLTTLGGSLRINGNNIQDSGGTTRIALGSTTTLTNTTTTLSGTTALTASSLATLTTGATVTDSALTTLNLGAGVVINPNSAGSINLGTSTATSIGIGSSAATSGIALTTGVTGNTGVAVTTGGLTNGGIGESVATTFSLTTNADTATNTKLALTDNTASSTTSGYKGLVITNTKGTNGTGTGAKRGLSIEWDNTAYTTNSSTDLIYGAIQQASSNGFNLLRLQSGSSLSDVFTVTGAGAVTEAAGLTVSSGGAAITGTTTINTSGSGTTAIGNSGTNWNITSGGALTLGRASNATGSLVFASSAAAGTSTFQAGNQGSTNLSYTLPIGAAAADSGYFLTSTTGGTLAWSQVTATGCSTCIVQVPTGNTANTANNNVISPTAASVIGLTINGTTNATSADVLDVVSGVPNSQTSTNGILFNQNSAGTTTNGLNITQTAGTLTNGISFSGTIGTDITTAAGRAHTVSTGTPGNDTASGGMTFTIPNAGGSAAAVGKASGGYSFTAGAGAAGASGANAGGAGGTFALTLGNGGNAGGAAAGGLGGGISVTFGNGGTTSTNTAGNGGGIAWTLGTGGAATGAGTGGTGGAFSITGGTGGTTSGGTAGVGGGISLIGGMGSTAAAGGALTFIGGAGNTSSGTGAGGAVSLTSGAGGATSGRSGNVTIASGTVTSGSTSGDVSLDVGTGGTAGALNIGTSAIAKTITIGSTGSTVQTIGIGSGTGANVVTIADIQTAGSLSIGNAMTSGTIAIGGGSAVRTGNITIGSTGQTSGVTIIRGGTGTGALGGSTSGMDLLPGVAGTINIGNGAGTGTITLGSSTAGQTVSIASGATGANTDVVNLGVGTGNKTVHIADNSSAVDIVTIGSTNGASSLTQRVGTGNFSLDGVTNSTYAIGASTTTGTITIGGTSQTGATTINSGRTASGNAVAITDNAASNASTVLGISATGLTTGTALQVTGGTTETTAGTNTGSALNISGLTYTHSAAETGIVAGLSFTDTSSLNSAGTTQTIGLNFKPTFGATGVSATAHEIYSAFIQAMASTGSPSGTNNSYGLRIGNQGASGVTNAYGLYIDAQSGAATNNFAVDLGGGGLRLNPNAVTSTGTIDLSANGGSSTFSFNGSNAQLSTGGVLTMKLANANGDIVSPAATNLTINSGTTGVLNIGTLTGSAKTVTVGESSDSNVSLVLAGKGASSAITFTNFTVGTNGLVSVIGGLNPDITTLSSAAGTSLTILPSAPSSTNAGTNLVLKGGAATTTGTGGNANINGGAGAGASGNGGAVNITGGVAGSTTAVGGAIALLTGTGGTSTGNSGALSLNTGSVTNNQSLTTGAVTINTGAATQNNTGNITVQSGGITTSGTSGNVSLEVGTGGTLGTIQIGNASSAPVNIGTSTTAAKTITIGETSNSTTAVNINSGAGYTIAGSTGVISLKGGAGVDITTLSSAAATTLTIQPSAPSSTNAGKALVLKGGNATTTGAGGTLQLVGGTGVSAAGSDVTIDAGTGSSTGAVTIAGTNAGNVNIGTATGANKTVQIGATATATDTVTLLRTGAGTFNIANCSGSGACGVSNGVLYVDNTSGRVAETAASTGAQCLQTSGSGTAPIWGACGGAASVRWDQILAPAASTNFALNMYQAVGETSGTTTFTWGTNTGASNLFTLQDTTGNTSASGYILTVGTVGTSTAKPFRILTQGTNVFDTTNAGAVTIGASSTLTGAVTLQSTNATTGINLNANSANNAAGAVIVSTSGLTTGTGLLVTGGSANIQGAGILASFVANSATSGTVMSLSGTGLTTGTALTITSTNAPTAGNTVNAVSLALTNTPTTSADTFRGINLAVTDTGVNSLADSVTGLRIDTSNVTNTTAGTTVTPLSVVPTDPRVNANGGKLLAASKIINVASADHSYLTLDNKELTVSGHKNQQTISNVNNVFVYDTTKDTDGGRWTSDERAQSSSWYNESRTAADACVIGTNTRCGAQGFPKKAIIVVLGAAGAGNVYIFDAKDNSLWMEFDQNAGATIALGVNANNTPSSVYGMNGNIYVGTNGSAATGLYEINFKTDKITRYNATDARDYSGVISGRNTVQGTAYQNQNRTAMAISAAAVNDVFAQVNGGGKTYVVVAACTTAPSCANGGVSFINETSQTVANFGPANKQYQSVFYTADDIVYGLNSTDSELDVWYGASSKSGNNVTLSVLYDETGVSRTNGSGGTLGPALYSGAPTINSSAPDALYVVNGTSDVDGQSNTIYVGHNAALSVIQEKQGDETNGAAKYYTGGANGIISEEMIGDARTMLPMAGSGTVATNTTLTAPDSDISVRAANFTTHGTNGVTHSSAVRGTGMTFDGTNYLCTGTTSTCADNTNLNFAQLNFSISFWIKTASSATARTIINKQATPGSTAGYIVQANASHQLTSTMTDGTTAVTATSTKIIDDNLWHHVVIVMNRTTTGSACNAAGNSCTLTQYIDGIADGTITNTTQSGSNSNTTQVGIMATSTGTQNVTGSIDEVTFTATAMSAAEVQHVYLVGSKALNNPNHSGSTTIRGVTLSADTANKINGSSVVKAINPLIHNGQIYLGTSGGVSIIGMNTDTLTDLYSTSITTKDDVNTNYDATNGNAVNTISVSEGYGTGVVLGIGFNNSGSGGTWLESNDTSVKDFLASSYDPHGLTLTQTNLNVDRVFRVTNQAATRLDDFGIVGTNQPQLVDIFKVDNNGAVVNVPTEALNTNTAGTNTYTGLAVSALNNITQNGAGGTTTFNGMTITNPNITQTAGTITANGQNITIGTVTTNGTQNGISLNIPSGSGSITTAGTINGLNIPTVATGPSIGTINEINLGGFTTTTSGGTTNGINIGSIGTNNGTSTALNIATGWGTAINVNDSTGTTNTLVNLTGSNISTGTVLAVNSNNNGGGAAEWISLTNTTPADGLRITTDSTLTNTAGNLIQISATTNLNNPAVAAPGDGSTVNPVLIMLSDSSTNTTSLSILNAVEMQSTINTSGAAAKQMNAFNADTPTLTGCSGGACTWSGFNVNTQSTGAAATITQNGLNVAASGISAGSLNGVNISGITAGAGTQNAVQIGSGWNNSILFGGSGSVTHLVATATSASAATPGLTIQTGNQTSGNFASGGLTIQTGTTAGTTQPGTLALTAGNASGAVQGGVINLTTGNGGTATGTGLNGGNLTFILGTGSAGAAGANNGGNSGTLTLNAATGGAGGTNGAGAGGTGGTGSALSFTLGNGALGGNGSATNGAGGVGGAFTYTTGTGGNAGAGAGTAALGGNGGALTLTWGNGGVGSAIATAGAGGTGGGGTWQLGTGGAGGAGGTANGAGGAGGTLTLNAGNGGVSGAGAGTSANGGGGGGLTFASGNGGNVGAGAAGVPGSGGGITLTTGNGGTGGTGNSSAGTLSLQVGTLAGTGTAAINIGTNSTVKTITLGTNTAGTADTININNTSTGGSVSIGAAMTGGTITIGGTGNAMTGSIKIGDGTGAQTIDIGNTNNGGAGGAIKTINIGNVGADTAADVINLGIQTGTVATKINLGTGSNNAQVLLRDKTAVPGANMAANGQIALGSLNTTANTGGRIWIRSNGANFTFQSTNSVIADYSEYLQQSDNSEPGDVMVLSNTQAKSVKRSGQAYDQNVLGVVTQYGTGYNNDFCFDEVSCDKSKKSNWANVGMLGQVYTKVSTENGTINPGDPLTTSSLTGVAMKATQASRIVGHALDSFDGTRSGQDMYNFPTYLVSDQAIPVAQGLPAKSVRVGKIVILLQAGWYDSAAPPPDDLTELKFTGGEAGLAADSPPQSGFGLIDSSGRVWDNNFVAKNAVIANLKAGGIDADNLKTKTINADAANIGTLNVDKIKANQIEGLSVLADEIITNKLSQKTASDSAQVTSLNNLNTQPNLTNNLNLPSLNVAGIATVSGKLAAGNLEVKNTSIFDGMVQVLQSITANNLIVTDWARFLSDVFIKGDVTIEGRPTFNKDTAGFALIKKDAQEVEVIFDKEYAQTPLVNISITLDDSVTDQDRALLSPQDLQNKINAQKALEDAVLNGDIRYIVTRRTTKDFVIKLNKAATSDLKFSWSALAVKDPKTVVSTQVLGANLTPTPQPSGLASTSPSPTAQPTISPSPTPSVTPAPKTLTINQTPTGFLRVRQQSDINSSEVAQVNPGQTFTILDSQNGWYKIQLAESQVGWVSGQYVTIN